MSLQDKALLVKLERKMWVPSKFDKTATSTVEQTHSVLDAGRFNKKLFHKNPAFSRITNASNNTYLLHQSLTLPWRHDGFNILPSANAISYYNLMSKSISDFESEVLAFDFDQAILDDHARLGSLYNRANYPADANEFKSRFKIKYNLYPLPDIHDFRIDIPESEKEKFREEMKAASSAIYDDIISRVEEVVSPLMEDKARWHKSIKTKIAELAGRLENFNIMEDSRITVITSSLQKLADNLDIERMKEDESYRNTIRQEAGSMCSSSNPTKENEVECETKEVDRCPTHDQDDQEVEQTYRKLLETM